ncbi:hypothetical protein EU522_01055 [Candidatus Thorarchaeota archaeon]|nr:MAG: hypothetical protein EU522_01055 [Candidatus Thorarchaeota archaeon]
MDLPILDYLLVYTQAGLPIYSKCFGTFCKAAFQNPELLSGFLSAIETIPASLQSDLSLESIKMGNTEMRFSKTTPDGHSIVVGLTEDSPEVAEKIFSGVSKTMAEARFRNVDWSIITQDLMEDFKDELLNHTLVDVLHEYGGFEDQCPLGDKCPIHTNAVISRRQRIWSAIRITYSKMKEKMSSGT